MKRTRTAILAVVTAAGLLAGTRGDAAEALPGANQATAALAEAPAIEPDAAAAVQRMQDYLQTVTAFGLRAETTTDEVLVDGPKVQFGGTIEALCKRPSQLWLRATRDDKDDRQFFYDGSAFALWIEAKNSWATAPVTGTVGEMIAAVESKYDLSFPLADLLRAAGRKELLADVEAGIMVGVGRVAGVECDHLAFHQKGVDWQLWIERGERPLPRKMTLTTLDEPSQPQHMVTLFWDLAPKLDGVKFTFTPPAGAARIVLAEAAAKASSEAAAQAAPATKKEGAR